MERYGPTGPGCCFGPLCPMWMKVISPEFTQSKLSSCLSFPSCWWRITRSVSKALSPIWPLVSNCNADQKRTRYRPYYTQSHLTKKWVEHGTLFLNYCFYFLGLLNFFLLENTIDLFGNGGCFNVFGENAVLSTRTLIQNRSPFKLEVSSVSPRAFCRWRLVGWTLGMLANGTKEILCCF